MISGSLVVVVVVVVVLLLLLLALGPGKVDTLPPLRMRRRLAPTMPAKLVFPDGGAVMVLVVV